MVSTSAWLDNWYHTSCEISSASSKSFIFDFTNRSKRFPYSENHPDIFVLGDQAHFQITNQTILPGLAPVAMQQGRHAAKNILKAVNGKTKADFVYRDKGQMATIGRRKAVMQTNSMEMAGLFAWLAWLFVHIYYLISFKNRFFVFYQWAWSYLTIRRGARLIISKEWHSTQR